MTDSSVVDSAKLLECLKLAAVVHVKAHVRDGIPVKAYIRMGQKAFMASAHKVTKGERGRQWHWEYEDGQTYALVTERRPQYMSERIQWSAALWSYKGATGHGKDKEPVYEKYSPTFRTQRAAVEWLQGKMIERGIEPGAPRSPKPPKNELTEALLDKAKGDWVRDADGNAVRWEQDHDALVKDAMWSWVGAPADMINHMRDERAGAPEPGSGSGKIARAQARALLTELATKGKPTPRLYRGDNGDGALGADPTSWSERRKVAEHWAQKSGGTVHELEPGAGVGLRMADYVTSGADSVERQWLVITP